jgi:DNA-directed RNA polymerase subunit RPC12/RpoP
VEHKSDTQNHISPKDIPVRTPRESAKRTSSLCATCKKSFPSSNMSRHERVHKTKNLTCPMCPTKMRRRDEYFHHLIRHVAGPSSCRRKLKQLPLADVLAYFTDDETMNRIQDLSSLMEGSKAFDGVFINHSSSFNR